ncbi:hypothetical protein [Candidatus Uabimicrobium sp. HlEnr_7]|uniref:hypothetical protein n=1 Tax=Candidatus Uabimicrobium helgolandensis TaxID=3095367 RepID=UPI0035562471
MDKKWIGRVVGALVVTAIILFLLSFTTFGAQYYESQAGKNPLAKGAAESQMKAAKIYSWWGNHLSAAKAFEKYYINYGEQDVKKAVEAQYLEMSALHSAHQYATCMKKIELFQSQYPNGEHDIWSNKVTSLYNSLKMKSSSLIVDEPVK